MSDLVERLCTLSRGDHARGCQGREYHCDCGYDAQAWEAADEAAARITALEASLAEAEGRVIAEVVAWLRKEALKAWGADTSGMDETAFIATALETGGWKK